MDMSTVEHKRTIEAIGWGEPEYINTHPSWDIATNNIIRESFIELNTSIAHRLYIFKKCFIN
ncbi:hypothetical protein [Providencia burhodogranariea]|uniref:Uncharacterized protein n=1 Tax=Providencia burhodogranariea DSM 19968 TaxID=1141662 RepID=K8WWU5_9GAMM|nr:hypothetical protein OOA_01400 [Providencia burhodogranariea DSM 19968]